MKVSQLLFPYLLQHKTLHIQGLGTLSFEGQPVSPEKGKDEITFPNDSVKFKADKKAILDPEFIVFISKETGKIKPLATADLESFIENGKQLLNISKPFILDGIGLLQQNIQHQLEFVQDTIADGITKETGSRKLRAQEEGMQFDDDYLHPSDNKGKAKGSNAVVLMLMIAGLGLIGYVAYFFYTKSSETIESEAPIQAKQLVLSSPPEDTTSRELTDTSASSNTSKAIVDSTVKILPNLSVQGFKVVLEIANQKRAMKRFADLKEWGHKVVMTTSDSIEYKIMIPVIAPLSDTTRYRDSLTHFFGKKVWIEVNADPSVK